MAISDLPVYVIGDVSEDGPVEALVLGEWFAVGKTPPADAG
jgi:hypothetical protein